MSAIAERILAAVPGCALASDQPYRETDLAIDYCEDVPPLPLDAAQRIAELMREAGLTAKVSSIHVNGWFGDYDKLAMTRRLFAERFALDLDAANAEVVFAGDSPNDAPMFAFLPQLGRRWRTSALRVAARRRAEVRDARRLRRGVRRARRALAASLSVRTVHNNIAVK